MAWLDPSGITWWLFAGGDDAPGHRRVVEGRSCWILPPWVATRSSPTMTARRAWSPQSIARGCTRAESPADLGHGRDGGCHPGMCRGGCCHGEPPGCLAAGLPHRLRPWQARAPEGPACQATSPAALCAAHPVSDHLPAFCLGADPPVPTPVTALLGSGMTPGFHQKKNPVPEIPVRGSLLVDYRQRQWSI